MNGAKRTFSGRARDEEGAHVCERPRVGERAVRKNSEKPWSGGARHDAERALDRIP
ncbi:MAG: hypothetical protein AB1546_12355 [bacterium]